MKFGWLTTVVTIVLVLFGHILHLEFQLLSLSHFTFAVVCSFCSTACGQLPELIAYNRQHSLAVPQKDVI
jgi:hypothetical protein